MDGGGMRKDRGPFKFENLEVWKRAIEFSDMIYEIARSLPKREEYNLGSQIVRAATSVCLNIAEGSTGQSDAENSRFVGMAIRSLVEVVACIRLIDRRNYLNQESRIEAEHANDQAHDLFAMLQAYRAKLTPQKTWTREEAGVFEP